MFALASPPRGNIPAVSSSPSSGRGGTDDEPRPRRAALLCAARAYLLVPALGSLGGCRDTGGGQAAPTFGGTEDWTSHETRSILMLGRGVNCQSIVLGSSSRKYNI